MFRVFCGFTGYFGLCIIMHIFVAEGRYFHQNEYLPPSRHYITKYLTASYGAYCMCFFNYLPTLVFPESKFNVIYYIVECISCLIMSRKYIYITYGVNLWLIIIWKMLIFVFIQPFLSISFIFQFLGCCIINFRDATITMVVLIVYSSFCYLCFNKYLYILIIFLDC